MTENSIENYTNQIALARTEIKNLRQQLSALKYEHLKEIKSIKTALSNLKCSSCNESSSHYTISNTPVSPTSPTPTTPDESLITYRPIGYIKTSFQNKRAVPRQPSVMAQAQGTVVIDRTVFSNPEHALSGLEEFSHMWIIFHFNCLESNSTPAKVSPPRLEGNKRGVFSTRSPHRPCALGLSLVQIRSIEGNNIHFSGVDMMSNTPVLDIKPYIPQYDCPTLNRPTTEGVRDGDVDKLDVAGIDLRRLSPLENPITATTVESPYSDEIPPPLCDTEGEGYARGKPDGQERFTPPAPINTDGIRIASWINNPPSQTYQVRFTDDASNRIEELIGDRSESFKVNITSLLAEDPRSNYVKNKYPEHEYCCVLEDLSISCVFDNSASVCTIVAVRNADEMNS